MKPHAALTDSLDGRKRRRLSAFSVVCPLLLVLQPFLQPAAAQEKKTEEPEKKTFQRKPYRVLISVAFDDSPRFPNAFRRNVLQGVENAAQRTIGQIWSGESAAEPLDVKENRWLLPARSSTLKRLAFADVVKQLGIEPFAPAEEDATEESELLAEPKCNDN